MATSSAAKAMKATPSTAMATNTQVPKRPAGSHAGQAKPRRPFPAGARRDGADAAAVWLLGGGAGTVTVAADATGLVSVGDFRAVAAAGGGAVSAISNSAISSVTDW
jgi:hypothetical protein